MYGEPNEYSDEEEVMCPRCQQIWYSHPMSEYGGDICQQCRRKERDRAKDLASWMASKTPP